MNLGFNKSGIAVAIATTFGGIAMSLTPGGASAATAAKPVGTYVAGDFHNHTTCSDGSISMQKLVKKSTDKKDTPWGLDWFVQAGHGGNGNRNCTLAEDASLATPAYPLLTGPTPFNVPPTNPPSQYTGPNTTWAQSIGAANIKGLVSGSGNSQNMWRWQSIQEFQYPLLEYLSVDKSQPLFVGVESVVAGHEHSSMSVITGQMPAAIFARNLPNSPGYSPLGNATALAKWEYCFDRGDSDTSRGNTAVGSGVGNNWDCSVAGSLNASDPSWNSTAQKLIPSGGAGTGTRGHNKTVEAMKWMVQNHPNGSYYVPAHLERAGPFNPDGNNGFNIEHLRDFNNAAPKIAFGFETQPGHGASDARGEYTIRRNNINNVNVDSVGGTTYGGTGVYGAQIGGVWDALLGEGRNFWYFASSDWHNRGSFGPDDRRSTQDFYPGEYARTYVNVVDNTPAPAPGKKKTTPTPLTPQEIVDGLRTGNAYVASGQLIDRLAFVACALQKPGSPTNPLLNFVADATVTSQALNAASANTNIALSNCVTMGQKLVVSPGTDITISIVVRDPSDTNYSPYTFPNPSLAQIGISQPLNAPVLDHVDVIRGLVTGYKSPLLPAEYAGQWPNDWITPYISGGTPTLATVPAAAKNTSAAVIKTFTDATWKSALIPQYKTMTFRIPAVNASQYVRLRGTNLPPSVPSETDANGNPLPDLFTNAGAVNPTTPGGSNGMAAGANLKIPCNAVGTTEYNGCPSHLKSVREQKYVSYDVAAWSDLWFYSNPIFIEVKGSTPVVGVK